MMRHGFRASIVGLGSQPSEGITILVVGPGRSAVTTGDGVETVST